MSSLKHSTHQKWALVDWLHYLENMPSVEIQLGLERIMVVADRLNLRQTDSIVVTVSGTNGKGSTVAALEAIYYSAGFKVASYTSPHLFLFNERICVNQQSISDTQLCDAFCEIENARGDIHLTYFEMTTLAALWYFKQQPIDIMILEVGMGGRLDATNIIDADLAIITTIDFDHQAYLGDTKEDIGYEKAGIMRANKPCIYADTHPPKRVLESARSLGAPIYCLDVDYQYKATHDTLTLEYGKKTLCVKRPNIHVKAAASALFAVDYLQAMLPVHTSTIQQAMTDVSICGRRQLIEGKVPTLYDVAHNPQAVGLLSEYVKQYKPKGRVFAVFSALQDKDLCGLIQAMSTCVDRWYPAILSSKRAATADLLIHAFMAQGIEVSSCFNDPIEAYQAAILEATSDDLIVVYGSFFMVSTIMAKQGE